MKNEYQCINFGFASAETEGAEDPQLLKSAFLDQFNAIDSIINGKKFIILGTKGSGKSAIGEKLRILAKEKYNLFVTVRYLSTFPYKSFGKIISGKDEPEIKYTHAWDWLLLVSLFNSFTKDIGIKTEDNKSINDLSKILKENSILPAEDLKQLANRSAKKNFKIKFPIPIPFLKDILIEKGKEKTPFSLQKANIPNLNELLLKELIQCSSDSRHLLIIDGLDDVMISSGNQARVLSALLQTCYTLNQILRRNDVPACIILLCRSDIYEVLPNPNKNKFKQDYGIVLVS